MKNRSFECRFGVGDPSGQHSDVWKIWASRNQPDVYIYSSGFQRIRKISIHGSGKRHYGITQEYWKNYGAEGLNFGIERHEEKWEGDAPTGHHDLFIQFRIRFPSDDLRHFELRPRDVSKSTWLTPAPQHQATEVILLAGGKNIKHIDNDGQVRNWPGRDSLGTRFLSAGPRSDGTHIWLVYFYTNRFPMKISENKRKEFLHFFRSKGLNRSNITSGHRITLFGTGDDSCRYCVEVAADSFIID